MNDLIFTGSTQMFTHPASVRVIRDHEDKCRGYKCDNLIKYKIAINDIDKLLYALSARYGWQICR